MMTGRKPSRGQRLAAVEVPPCSGGSRDPRHSPGSSPLTRLPRDGLAEGIRARGAPATQFDTPPADRTQGYWKKTKASECALRRQPASKNQQPFVRRAAGRRTQTAGRPSSRPLQSAVARRAGQGRRAQRPLTRPSTAARHRRRPANLVTRPACRHAEARSASRNTHHAHALPPTRPPNTSPPARSSAHCAHWNPARTAPAASARPRNPQARRR